MFCTALTLMLLCQSLGHTLATPTPDIEQKSCESKTSRQTRATSLVQIRAKTDLSSSVYVDQEHNTEGYETHQIATDTSNTKFGNVEHWQEVMQYELFPARDLSSGNLEVSKEQWARAFDTLDKNGDGKLDGHDLDSANSDTAKHHFNVSQEHYRIAVARMAQKFPEFAGFMVTHQPALVFFSETNTSAPPDAPVPDSKSMALFAQRTQKLALLQEATNISDCQHAFAEFAYDAVEFGLWFAGLSIKDYLGDKCPITWMKDLQDIYEQVDQNIITKIGENIQDGNYWKAAGNLWNLVVDLYNKGALEELIKEAFKVMSWWEFATMGVKFLATVTAHLGGLGWGAMLALAHHLMTDGWDLVDKAFKVVDQCR